jgi:ribosomal protein L33
MDKQTLEEIKQRLDLGRTSKEYTTSKNSRNTRLRAQ